MSLVWLSTSFCFYLIVMLTNTFDDIYVTGITSGISEIVADIFAGVLYEKIGVKSSLIISFLVSTIGGVLILAWGLNH